MKKDYIRSRAIKHKESLMAFLMRNVDETRFKLVYYKHSSHNTYHFEIWRHGRPEHPEWVFEWTGFTRCVRVDTKYCK